MIAWIAIVFLIWLVLMHAIGTGLQGGNTRFKRRLSFALLTLALCLDSLLVLGLIVLGFWQALQQ